MKHKLGNIVKKIVFVFLACNAIGIIAQPKKMKSLETYVWGENDPYAIVPEIPEKWKDESAVIILKDIDYYYYKGKGKLNIHIISRNIVKLNDQAAINIYSEFGNLSNYKQLIIRIIKPDGSIKTIDVENEKVKTSEPYRSILRGSTHPFIKTSKLAIPDLEVGDILDYCVYYKEGLTLFGVLEAPSVRDVINEEYPIMDYTLDIHSKKDFYISIKTENGAPEAKDVSSEKGKDRQYSFQIKDVEKIDPILWEYPLMTYPYIKFQVSLEKDKLTKAFTGEEKSEIKHTVNDEEVLKYYRAITVFDHGYKGSDRFLQDKDFSPKQKVEEIYYYMRQYYLNQFMEASIAYNNNLTVDSPFSFYAHPNYITTELKFINYYVSFLREENIPFELIAAIPRSQGKIDDLLFPDDITLLLKIKLDQEEPLYVTQFGNHTNFNYIPYYLEGNEAYSLETGNGHRLETIKKVTVPVSDYNRNNSYQKYEISFLENFQTIQVNRNTAHKGHNKIKEIDDRLNALNFIDEDHSKYGTKRLYDRLKKKKNKNKYEKEFPAFKEKIETKQKEWYEKNLEEELDIEVEGFSFEVTKTGRYNIEDVLSFNEEFTINNDLLKRAGKNYLLEIGRFIGGQIAIDEKDKERIQDIHMPYPRSFANEMIVNIPEDYEVTGYDKLNMKIENETGGFVSEATLEGNTLTIKTHKYYVNNYEPNGNWIKMLQFLEASYQFSQEKILLKKK